MKQLFDVRQLELWIEEAIEGRLSADNYRKLKKTILNDAAALDHYIEYVSCHAALNFQAGPERMDDDKLRLLFGLQAPGDLFDDLFENENPERDVFVRPDVSAQNRTDESDRLARISFRKKTVPTVIICTITCVTLFFTILLSDFAIRSFFSTRDGQSTAKVNTESEPEFAAIVKTTNCLWGDSMTKTAPGSRLGSCTLRLERGVALVRFDCGVSVSLEGPSIFEIKDKKHGILHSGRLVADIETQEGKGFIVETSESRIKDLGTRFGVYSPHDKPSIVNVIDGTVEVFPRESDQSFSLQKGESIVFPSRNDESANSKQEISIPRLDTVQLSTAAGRGKEAWTIFTPNALEKTVQVFPQGIPDTFMFVKTDKADVLHGDRKIIFSIDLSFLNANEKAMIDDVALYLSYGPTELGYVTGVSDSIFTVYALTVEALDDWNPETLDWSSFPGNAPRSRLLPEYWKSIGNFTIKQGNREGVVQVDGKALVDFIRRDTNDLVTFAVVCETFALEDFSLVFGIANKHHPTLMPPRLKIHLNKNTQ